MKVKNKIFHLECFHCVACSKQLVRGEEFALRDDGLFCKADHIILEKAREHYVGEKLTTSLSTGKIKRRTCRLAHNIDAGRLVIDEVRLLPFHGQDIYNTMIFLITIVSVFF